MAHFEHDNSNMLNHKQFGPWQTLHFTLQTCAERFWGSRLQCLFVGKWVLYFSSQRKWRSSNCSACSDPGLWRETYNSQDQPQHFYIHSNHDPIAELSYRPRVSSIRGMWSSPGALTMSRKAEIPMWPFPMFSWRSRLQPVEKKQESEESECFHSCLNP